MISIATKLMIVNVSISVWEGRRLDRAVTRKTIVDNNVNDDDALRVNKLLIGKESFKEVHAQSSAIRALLYARTLPWKDNGDRALMRQGYMDFVSDFHALEVDWHAAVDNFVRVRYPAEVAKASFRLADAYNPDDYPHQDELRSKFKLTLGIDAVAEAGDFRVKLDDDIVSDIQAQIAEATEQRVHSAMRDVWGRIETLVKHFAERTAPDTQRFYDTTVTNLRDLMGLMPSLNLLGDPDLKAIQQRINDTLCAYEPQDLRKDLKLRASAKADAENIIEQMSGFMAAFK
jgi:hypothetical protein